jgi:hypothetical protein
MLELHQLNTTPETFGEFSLEFRASQLKVRSGWCAYVRGKWLAGALVKANGLVKEKLRETARCEPREAAVVSGTPESKAPITLEPVPAKKS